MHWHSSTTPRVVEPSPHHLEAFVFDLMGKWVNTIDEIIVFAETSRTPTSTGTVKHLFAYEDEPTPQASTTIEASGYKFSWDSPITTGSTRHKSINRNSNTKRTVSLHFILWVKVERFTMGAYLRRLDFVRGRYGGKTHKFYSGSHSKPYGPGPTGW